MRDQTWVSKTDVTDYLRCPYAFWLADSGQLSRAELLSPFEQRLARDGVSFERRSVEAAPPIVLPPGGEDELFSQDYTLLAVRAFRNDRLRLRGRPDGLVTAGGALQPIEVKSHRLVRHSDRIELAFYWMLLGEKRTDSTAEPLGWVFLRSEDGSVTREPVPLTPAVLAETEALIEEVRHARRHGVEPVFCRCTVCSGIRRQKVLGSIRARRHVSAVIGVGGKKLKVLQDLGCQTWEDLLKDSAEDLARAFNAKVVPQKDGNDKPASKAEAPRMKYAEISLDDLTVESVPSEEVVPLTPVRSGEYGVSGRTVNVREVMRWQTHARALIANEVRLFDDAESFPVPERYITFDMEYDPQYLADTTCLLGIRVVRPEGDLCYSIWASPAGHAAALAQFSGILGRFADLPVVTWNGKGADLWALRTLSTRAGDSGIIEDLAGSRHIDLYGWTSKNMRLPIPDLRLKNVVEYFGITRESRVTGGEQAKDMLRQYQRCGDQELKAELVEYNLEDLRSLVCATEYLRAHAARHSPGTSAVHSVLGTVVSEHEPGGPPAWRPELRPASATRKPSELRGLPRETLAIRRAAVSRNDVPGEVIELAAAGKKIGAIKRYRVLTGASLREARDIIDGL